VMPCAKPEIMLAVIKRPSACLFFIGRCKGKRKSIEYWVLRIEY
jgi:hypothetical protein